MRSLIRILLTAMFLGGHKNGISSIESSSIDNIPLLCAQKHAVYKIWHSEDTPNYKKSLSIPDRTVFVTEMECSFNVDTF